MLFTKPANYFAGRSYPIATQYITGGPPNPVTVTIPQAASDCQANFGQNGNYNQSPNNPALFDTASVNSNGQFTAGNLSLPDFTLKGTWDNGENIITNGEIWLPYRFLWAIWGNNPNKSQTPFGQVRMSFANNSASSTNSTVLYDDVIVASTWGTLGFELAVEVTSYAILGVNLSGIGLGANQGIALNISCVQDSSPLSLSISADKTTWTTVPPGFNATVAQQCFYIAPSLIPSTNPFYLKITNQISVSTIISALQLLY
jgi:hypothetical protein